MPAIPMVGIFCEMIDRVKSLFKGILMQILSSDIRGLLGSMIIGVFRSIL
jgi:hypothetical protein